MKEIRHLCLLLIVVGTFSVVSSGQEVPTPVAKVVEDLECKMQKSMPDWTREPVEPILKSERVLISVWMNCGRRVKVSINYLQSEAEAIEGIRRFATQVGVKRIEGLGDEAYAWGYSDAIGMRKGNLVFSISTVALPSLPGVAEGESSVIRRAEEVALNKGFARIISNILSNPNIKCGELFERFR